MQPPGGAAAPESRPASQNAESSERPHRGRREGNRQHTRRPEAAVTRIDQARARRNAPAHARSDEGDTSHLPAFLLRPVPLKA
jgi:hypothetical protein